MGQVLVARRSFSAGTKIVKRGQHVAASDPVVAGREGLFEPVENTVEQATANPGERRSVKRPAKKAAAKD